MDDSIFGKGSDSHTVLKTYLAPTLEFLINLEKTAAGGAPTTGETLNLLTSNIPVS